MLTSAAEFLKSQALWNLAESGVQYTHQIVGHYLAPAQETTSGEMDPDRPPAKKIYCMSFNQDFSSLAVGHDGGYIFYSLRSLENLEKYQDAKVPERACIVERLFSSSLITVVSMKSTRKLQVYYKRVIVCLEDAIHIHNVRDMRLLHMIKDTPPNPNGIIDLSSDDENCFLAFPASSNTGHVHIFDADNLNTVCQITAHDSMLAAIRFNREGNKLATGSEKGTVIRVFAMPTGERLFEFTRGVARCVQISSLAFSQDSRYLCLSSNTETVHIFALIKNEQNQHDHSHHHQKTDEPNQEGLGSWIGYFSQQASAYLPQQVNDLMLREKSAATAKLPIGNRNRTIVAMPRIQGTDYLLVASLDGYLFCYSLPNVAEGECRLMRQFKVGPQSAENDQHEIEGMPININRSTQRDSRNSESEAQKLQTPTKSAANQMRAGSGGGSSSSLSSASGTPITKQAPPPVPPNPPKRATSTSKSTTPIKEFTKANTNPFDMEDLIPPLDEGLIASARDDRAGSSDLSQQIGQPAPLDDLDEFPPLHHPAK